MNRYVCEEIVLQWRRQPWFMMAARTTKVGSLRKGSGQADAFMLSDSSSPASIPTPSEGAILSGSLPVKWFGLGRDLLVLAVSGWLPEKQPSGAAQHLLGIQLWELGHGFQGLHLLALFHICTLPYGETWRQKTGKGRGSWFCSLSTTASLYFYRH